MIEAMTDLLADCERKLGFGHYKQVNEVRKENSQTMPQSSLSNTRNNTHQKTDTKNIWWPTERKGTVTEMNIGK